jgi:LmbE family N-acetylglucosaminyl deacetylase
MPINVLVVAAHPDDEVLGVGGAVARHAESGDHVYALILAEGITARATMGCAQEKDGEIATLQMAARKAASVLGAQPPRFAGLADNQMDTVPLLEIVKYVETAVAELEPTVVYTHHGGDLNIDHRITHQAVLTACRPIPESPVRAIYAFETASSTEWASPGMSMVFAPNHFVDIECQLARKLQALECYASEMRAFPHARSITAVESIARFRGTTVGVHAAEAFVSVRVITR